MFYSFSPHAILLEGETSVGKTSLIQYLARQTHTKCVRINNHEHTDISEYIGTYAREANSDSMTFAFVEGCLL